MYESNQQGVAYSDFHAYIAQALPNIGQRLNSESIPVLNVLDDLSKLKKISAFEFKIAKRTPANIQNADIFDVVPLLKEINYDNLHINMTASIQKNHVGLGDKAKLLATNISNKIFQKKMKGDVLIVSGVDEFLEKIAINLTEKFLRTFITFDKYAYSNDKNFPKKYNIMKEAYLKTKRQHLELYRLEVIQN